MQRLGRCQYISFDVYDTLVHRVVGTEHIYQVMEEILREEGIMENFAQRRVMAEKQCQNSRDATVSFADIYSAASFADITASARERAMTLEKQLELENTVADDDARDLYRQYEAQHPVICTSDMYFDGAFIQEMLCRHGYRPSKVYVSADAFCSKRDRKLYHYVADDLHIATHEILHLGDSLRSDWLNARLAGCQSRWLPRQRETKDPEHYNYQIGFRLFGPMMYEFCRWIHEYDDGEMPMLFLSREGEFIKQCYDLIYPENNSFIMYVSRQAILHSMANMVLSKCPVEEFRALIRVANNEHISSVLRRIGIDVKRYESSLKSCGLSPEDRYDDRVDSFFQQNREALLADLEKVQSQTSIDYLTECLTKSNILVDVGWRGSMQKLLQKFIRLQGIDNELMGLYLGIDDTDQKAGFLYQDKGRNRKNIRCFSGLLEIIMMPNHGTTLGYKESPDGIVPVFGQSEFSEESVQTIASLQRGMLDMVQHCATLQLVQHFQREDIIRELIRFGCHPKRRAMKLLGPLEFFENNNIYRLIENTSLLHFGRLYDSFIITRWKTGFLKSVFKLDLPYNWAINFLREATLRM